MMRKYETPEMETMKFRIEDVITTSGEPEMDAGELDALDLQ